MSDLIALFESGVSLSDIALAIGVSQATISRQIAKLGLKRNPIWRMVTDEQIINTANCSCREAAVILGISSQAVHERRTLLGVGRPLSDLIDEIADKNRIYDVDLGHFERLDKIGCYWLGFLYADGCNRRHGRTHVTPSTVSVSLQYSDRDVLLNFLCDLGAPTTLLDDNQAKNYSRVVIHHRRFGQMLCSLGMDPRNNYKVATPELPYPDQFCRGYLDGDGGIYIRPGRLLRTGRRGKPFLRIGIASTTEPFGRCLVGMIESGCGVRIGGPYRSKSIFTLVATHRKAETIGSWLWRDPVRAMSRKAIVYSNWVR